MQEQRADDLAKQIREAEKMFLEIERANDIEEQNKLMKNLGTYLENAQELAEENAEIKEEIEEYKEHLDQVFRVPGQEELSDSALLRELEQGASETRKYEF